MEWYIVQPGDTLYDIALEYRIPMGRLMADNGFPRRPLVPGQALLLSPPAPFSLSLWHGTEGALTPLPLLAPEERTGRQYEHLHFEEQAERAERVLLQTPEHLRPVPLPALRARLEALLRCISGTKLVLDLDGQGRDRVLSTPQFTPLTGAQGEALAAERRASIRFDPAAGLARFRYSDDTGREHEVQFLDLRSLFAQLALAEELGLSGVVLPRPCPAAAQLLNFRPEPEPSP